MKQKVIEFFQDLPKSKSEQFNRLFELYRQSPNKSIAAERSYNSSGYSPGNLESLKYDLQQLHGIKDKELIPKPKEESVLILQLSISDKLIKLFSGIVPQEILMPTSEEKLLVDKWEERDLVQCFSHVFSKEYVEPSVIFEKAKAEFPEFLELLEKAKEELVPVSPIDLDLAKKLEVITGENEDLKSELESAEDEKADLEFDKEELASENEELKLQIDVLLQTESEHNGKLRDEFPFLNEKDCPDIAHVLVGRKVAAWKRYQANHEKIQLDVAGTEKLSEEERLEASKNSVEDFEENQAIYDELNNYKENGEFLKKHPLFRTIRLQEEVDKMTAAQMFNFKNASIKYFSDNGNKLKAEGITEERKNELNAKIAERQEKIDLVNKKLNIDPKK